MDDLLDEDFYVWYLNHERQFFARALVEFGGYTAAQAEQEALERYPYEPPNEDRGAVFHDLPWHWAMVRLHGDCFWVSRPELTYPPHDFGTQYMAAFSGEGLGGNS
jgi:hypothetical protein